MKNTNIFIIGLLSTILLVGCGTTIPGGYHGVYWQRYQGIDTTVYSDGFKWHWPWSDVLLYDTRWKTESEQVDILSLDDLHMMIELALRLKPRVNELYALHQEIGSDYYNQIVQQQFRSVARGVFAKYKYNDITKKSVEIQNSILAQLKEAIEGKHLDLNAVEIKHVEYPAIVAKAADEKLATEQRLSQKEFEREIAKRDAEIKIIEAKAQQTSQTIIDSTLTPTYLQYRALDVQRMLANSNNATFYFIPLGPNGLPVLLDAGIGKKK
jgi:regulator of protease activity HflC (stomatin/prohibitin superfamily)